MFESRLLNKLKSYLLFFTSDKTLNRAFAFNICSPIYFDLHMKCNEIEKREFIKSENRKSGIYQN